MGDRWKQALWDALAHGNARSYAVNRPMPDQPPGARPYPAVPPERGAAGDTLSPWLDVPPVPMEIPSGRIARPLLDDDIRGPELNSPGSDWLEDYGLLLGMGNGVEPRASDQLVGLVDRKQRVIRDPSSSMQQLVQEALLRSRQY